jgi:hypothetical protein
LFCHGSPVFKTVNTYSIDMINNFVSMYLNGIDNQEDSVDDGSQVAMNYYKIVKHGNSSVIWNRDFGETELLNHTEIKLTKQLNTILDAYNNKNSILQKNNNAQPANCIAIGHTIQDINKNGINSICNGRVWRCDVAMSKAFGDNKVSKHRKPQVLEILNDNTTKVLR